MTMADQAMTAGSDADSFDLAPDSPLNREKTRTAHASWVLELEQKPEFRLLQAFSAQSQVTLEEAIHQLVDLTHKAALEEEIGNHGSLLVASWNWPLAPHRSSKSGWSNFCCLFVRSF
jgi:hypothetical protein